VSDVPMLGEAARLH